MALTERNEEGADSDPVREPLALAAERMTEPEVEAETGAPAGVRGADRPARGNGHRKQAWEAQAGRVDLAIPKPREGSPPPSLLEPRRTAERAPTAAVREACTGGWMN